MAEPPAIDIGADILNIERHAGRAGAHHDLPSVTERRGLSRDLRVDRRRAGGDAAVRRDLHRARSSRVLIAFARITRCSGRRITIVLRPGEHAKFTAINRTGTISFGLLFMLGAFPLYLTFEREFENPKLPSPKSQIKTSR